MPTRLLLVADTHVPKRARALPVAVQRAASAADLIVHAGDWVDESVLDELGGIGPLLGVWGNNDGPALRARLPEIARAVIEGVRVAVVHETGAAAGREKRMDAAFPDTDLLVFGHSHIPWDTTTPEGLRLLNPGSPTDRRRQPACTIMTLTLADGGIHDVRTHEVSRA
ncbi:metallophosphoesterase family protein [Microbacterium sp. NPDC090007]|uniref:metallophosphoesterase family protein n=1 Tax=Microbacterium sp. NPDC090007 TaxID=3364204 RepID=UPI00381B6042